MYNGIAGPAAPIIDNGAFVIQITNQNPGPLFVSNSVKLRLSRASLFATSLQSVASDSYTVNAPDNRSKSKKNTYEPIYLLCGAVALFLGVAGVTIGFFRHILVIFIPSYFLGAVGVYWLLRGFLPI